MGLRIGIDVGGTFTDFVMLDRNGGPLHYHKEQSTPADPAAAIDSGLAALLEKAGVGPDAVEFVVHGTTISLNAILQRRGARAALVVSAGNRDLLEIARVHMDDSYGFFAQPDAPLVTRDHVAEVSTRIMADGRVARIADAAELDTLAARIGAMDVQAVSVVLLNAPANVAAEQALARELTARLSIPVSASTDLWSEVREYERGMVAVMNAYITPILQHYYDRLQTNIAARGITAPVSITTSNGGSVDIETAYRRPIDSTLSGPASGVVAAIHAAAQAGVSRIITFDMGGTSADIAIAEGDVPEITTHSHLGEIPLILPIVNVSAIGAGGGSIIRVDDGGLLKVGPTSAGARPGPACYDQGGTDPTMTDCYLACGFLDPDRFAAGNLKVDRALSIAALERTGAALFAPGADLAVRTADAALRVASSMMATEVRKTLARRGSDPTGFVLLPYGGAGPTHAALLAQEAGLDRILVAPRPGVFCALGAAVANLRRDFVESCRLLSARADAQPQLATTLDRLKAHGQAWAHELADRVSDWRFELVADVRYPDQAFELAVRLPDLTGDLLARISSAFHAEHDKLYGFNAPDSGVEISRIVLSVIGSLPQGAIAFETSVTVEPDWRPIYINGAWHDALILPREALPADGSLLAGPAVIEQADTTTVVPPGWTARRLPDGAMMLDHITLEQAR